MADFKTHLTVGTATGFGLSMFAYMVDWISNIYMAVIVFFATSIGSFLPDMDSESGLPVKIIFGMYAYLAATLAMYFVSNLGLNFIFVLLAPALAFIIVKVFLEKIFNKFTSHRGIFHSVPAILIVFLICLLIASKTNLPVKEQFIISLSVAMGYFCHLLLDEIFAFNFLTSSKSKDLSLWEQVKKRFTTKKSFGTALDLGFNQPEKYPGIIAYAILIVLIFFTFPSLKEIWFFLK